jgi:predicted membrane-bound spermidine synthase
VVLPALLIFHPTALMGESFPLLQKAVQTDLSRVGTRIGMLLMANIAGSVVGTVVTGWVALAWLGAAGTLKMLLLVSALFPAFGLVILSRGADRRRAFTEGAAIAAMVTLVIVLPDRDALWERLHGATSHSIVHGEDGSGTSVLKVEPSRFQSRVVVFANGTSQSRIPYGGVHTVLGALPAFMLPRPRTAVIIGLGSGDTVFAVAGRRDIARIQCIEIIKPQLATLRRLTQLYPYRALETVLTDRRIEHRYGDGRLFIMQSNAKYDLIEADALKPASACQPSARIPAFPAAGPSHAGRRCRQLGTDLAGSRYIRHGLSPRAQLRRRGARQQQRHPLPRGGDSRAAVECRSTRAFRARRYRHSRAPRTVPRSSASRHRPRR